MENIFGSNFPMQTVNLPRSMSVNDAAIAGGMAHLIGELEKLDTKLYEPLTSTTWARDIVARTGGGFIDYASTINVAYGTTGGNEDGIIGGQTNNIPVVQADIGKDLYKVYTWANVLKVPFVDQAKMKNINRSLEDILDKGIHLNYDKTIDQNTYLGHPTIGSYGLCNSPEITAMFVPAGAAGGLDWYSKTPTEMLADINRVQAETWAASGHDLSGMANHILLPPELFSYLAQTPLSVDTTGGISILTYLMNNNLGKTQGRDLYIAPSVYCKGAGVGGTNRMVGYANDEERVRFELPVPISRQLTQASATEFGYLTVYCGQFSEIEWIYNCHAIYVDGI